MSLIGKTAEVRLRAFPPDAAEALHCPPDEGFPAVVASSRNSRLMVHMELAATWLMQPAMEQGQSSVALEMNVNWLVMRTQGDLRAVAAYLGAQGRVHHFRVNVFDKNGLVACGEHTRAVVVPCRLLAGARRRAGLPAMLLHV